MKKEERKVTKTDESSPKEQNERRTENTRMKDKEKKLAKTTG